MNRYRFYFIGFYVLLVLLVVMVTYVCKTTSYLINGSVSWSDMYSNNANATSEFLQTVFKMDIATPDPQQNSMDYRPVRAAGSLFPNFAIMQITDEYRQKGLTPHSTLYFTVKNYEKVHQAMLENGAKILVEPQDKNNMRFGIYVIPGDVEIAIIKYNI